MNRRTFVKAAAATPAILGMRSPAGGAKEPIGCVRKWPEKVLVDNPIASRYYPLGFAAEVKSVHHFAFNKRPYVELDVKLGCTEMLLLYGAKVRAPKKESDLLKSSWSGSKLLFHCDHRGTDEWYDKMEDAGAVESFMGPSGAAFPHVRAGWMMGWGIGPDWEGCPPDMKGNTPDPNSFQGYFCPSRNRIVVEMNHYQGWDLTQIEVELIMARYAVIR